MRIAQESEHTRVRPKIVCHISLRKSVVHIGGPRSQRPSRGRGTGPSRRFDIGLDLPRGRERERVYVHEHEYELRGSEARALPTIGTFRVVLASNLRDDHGRPGDFRHGDLKRSRSAGRVRRVAPVESDDRTTLVTLTERGRELLEHHRTPNDEPAQRFHGGPSNARELTHDALYRAYLRSADRLHAQGARLHRVVLDDDLKREYQAFL